MYPTTIVYPSIIIYHTTNRALALAFVQVAHAEHQAALYKAELSKLTTNHEFLRTGWETQMEELRRKVRVSEEALAQLALQHTTLSSTYEQAETAISQWESRTKKEREQLNQAATQTTEVAAQLKRCQQESAELLGRLSAAEVTPLVYHFLYAPPHLIDWRASAAEVNPLTTSSYISLVFTFLPYIRSYQMIPPHSHPHALSPIFL